MEDVNLCFCILWFDNVLCFVWIYHFHSFVKTLICIINYVVCEIVLLDLALIWACTYGSSKMTNLKLLSRVFDMAHMGNVLGKSV